jgi:hypothetical protein
MLADHWTHSLCRFFVAVSMPGSSRVTVTLQTFSDLKRAQPRAVDWLSPGQPMELARRFLLSGRRNHCPRPMPLWQDRRMAQILHPTAHLRYCERSLAIQSSGLVDCRASATLKLILSACKGVEGLVTMGWGRRLKGHSGQSWGLHASFVSSLRIGGNRRYPLLNSQLRKKSAIFRDRISAMTIAQRR